MYKMSSTERIFKQFYVKLVKSLPMENAIFLAELISSHLIPTDLRKQIRAEATPADKAMCFLDHKIHHDISKGDFKSFNELLNIMKKRDFRNLNRLAEKIRIALTSVPVESSNNIEGTAATAPAGGLTVASLDSKPQFSDLKQKFGEIDMWESVCPFLLNDDDGQKTKWIKRGNSDLDSRRIKMLREFLEQPNPTWRDVVRALRGGGYNRTADEIEHELQVSTGTVKAPSVVLTASHSLDSKPKFTQLQEKFKRVADWDAVCPYLLNDEDGQKTKWIRISDRDVDSRRNEMLWEFLERPNPTWSKVVQALRTGRYDNTADEIEHELQVPRGTVKASPVVLTASLDLKPKFTELKKKFERVADWQSVCPYLLNDEDGQKTRQIRIRNFNVDGSRNEMLETFLEQPNPTWRNVILALRAGRYNHLADELQRELLIGCS